MTLILVTAAFFSSRSWTETFSASTVVLAKSNSPAGSEHSNSQIIALLNAPSNAAATQTNSRLGRGGGGVYILDGSSLRADGQIGLDAVEEDLTSERGKIRTYVVEPGDTLSDIASRFDVTTNTIRWNNDIPADDTVSVGQELVILPVTGITHTVEAGESLSWIVDHYGGSIEKIREFNGLTEDDVLAVGDELIIPDGALPHSHDAAEPADTNSHAAHTPSPAPSSNVSTGGYFSHPVSGSVLTQGHHGFNAVDFGAPHGTPISAAADGTVIISRQGGWNGGYGSYVVIEHNNGTQTLYAHNSSNAVSVGEQVATGQVIGYIGDSGRSTGPHLHFEVRGGQNPFIR